MHARFGSIVPLLAAAARITTIRDWLRVARDRRRRRSLDVRRFAPPISRAAQAADPADLAFSIPDDPDRAVFGAFQRLRLHTRWMAEIGAVDAVFVRSTIPPAPELAKAKAYLRENWRHRGRTWLRRSRAWSRHRRQATSVACIELVLSGSAELP